MEKKIKLFNYRSEPKIITIPKFEDVKLCVFEIISGDGILHIIYNNGKMHKYNGCDEFVYVGYHDGTWVLEPKDIDILNEMQDNYDTDKLDEVVYGN